MELEQIRIFIAAAERGSLSAAAGELYVSHSTVSRTVRALERELGAELLTRDSRGVTPTAAGRALYDGGRELLARAEAMTELIAGLGGKPCTEEK